MRARHALARAAFASASLVLLLIIASPVQGASESAEQQPRLDSLTRSGATVAFHRETGAVRFIGTRPGQPIARPSGLTSAATPASVARAFLDSQGKAFGLESQERELQLNSIGSASAGRSSVRFQQLHEGVPVLGGELVVNLDREKNVLSAGGEVLPSPDVSVEPQVTIEEAQATAIAAVAKARSVAAATLQASKLGLWIYDSRIMGGPGLDRPTLVWRMDVTGEGTSGSVDEFVLVDAQLGAVALHFDQLKKARNRQICDANNAEVQVPCTSPVRVEGGAASAIQDVNDAYDYSGDTYDFYQSVLGRDSIDDAGMALKSTTRFCRSGYACPYQNAFWNGEQMVYGQGFASADDVVAHELTHGVTDYSSSLFYFYQSGAINESISDVIGEIVDLTNGAGTDTAGTRWLIGEDLSGGAGRDMEDPPAYGDPDSMTSANYFGGAGDNGGVHYNSGVGNKAAFLITDGGSFNGKTVTGLGTTKAAHIFYEADTNLLTSGSDYADLYNYLQQACTNLIGTAGITSSDCGEVADAVDATEMNIEPPAAPNPEAPVCAIGEVAQNLFSDNLENTASGNWTLQTGSGSNKWYYPQIPNPYSFDATNATSGTKNFWAYDYEAVSDYSIAMTSSVAIPAGSTPYFRFNHAHMFESSYDGGVVEYSTNGGGSWNDSDSILTDNGYSGTISSGWGNPLGGRSGFVSNTNGYISSRADLSTLAGQNVRFRFRMGTDSSGWDYGWFVDDIRIYTCSTPATPASLSFSQASSSVAETARNGRVTIRRANAVQSQVTVLFSTATGGSATAGSDYTTVTNQVVTFNPGETEKTVSVPIINDSAIEGNETISLSLSSPSGAVLGSPSTATLTIVDNDTPTVRFSASSYSVNEGAGSATVTVNRTGTTIPSSVVFRTANGTATAGSDYSAVNQTVSFAIGQSSRTVSVPIINDEVIESSETVSLSLSSPSGANLGTPSTATLTITDNDVATIVLSASSYSVNEGAGSASITVRRSGALGSPVSALISTGGGSATAGSDYTAVNQLVSFAAGDSEESVAVPIVNDTADESDETVNIALSGPSAGTAIGSPSGATLTIVDNDEPSQGGGGDGGGDDGGSGDRTGSGTSSNGKITMAKLGKKTFARAHAKKVKLTIKFAPKSKKFNFLLQIKKGKKWLKVRALNRTGSFLGKKTMTVKSFFGSKGVKKGSYRLKLTADANSRLLSFRVT